MEKRKKILIVEDNDILREMLSVTLLSHGYLVETAHDGLSGLQKLEKYSYDLLITDNQMPRMEGLELIREIYRREMCIKTLFISGQFTKDIMERARERGVLEFLAKPFSFNLMLETVRKVLGKDEVSEETQNLDNHPHLLEAAAL